MWRFVVASAVVLAAATGASAAMQPAERELLIAAARALHDAAPTVAAADWARTFCAAVFPNLRRTTSTSTGAIGRGVVSCRAGDGWSAPAFLQMVQGPLRFPADVDAVDVVLLATNEQGVQRLLQERATVSFELTVAYSRSAAGPLDLDMSGAVLRPDATANVSVYGRGASPRTVLATREISAPTEAHDFLRALSEPGKAAATERSPERDPAAPPNADQARGTGGVRSGLTPSALDDLRRRVAEMQQAVDRMLAESQPDPANPAGSGAVSVDRTRLVQLRAQLDALLAALVRR